MSRDFNPYQPPEADMTNPGEDAPAPKPWFALTLTEVILVLVILAGFAVIIFPALSHSRHRCEGQPRKDGGPRPAAPADGR